LPKMPKLPKIEDCRATNLQSRRALGVLEFWRSRRDPSACRRSGLRKEDREGLLFPNLSEIDPQLLALLVKMAALQTQRFGGVGDVMVVALDLVEDHLPLELLYAVGECP